MRILLINPNYPQFERFTSKGARNRRDIYPPLGLAYIASVLREHGHTVFIIDCLAEGYKSSELIQKVEEIKPFMVGITSTTATLYEILKLTNLLKTRLPNIKIVVGGVHATFRPMDFLNKTAAVDVVVRGEGEYTFLDLVSIEEFSVEKLKKIKGLSFIHNGEIKNTPNRDLIGHLDELPFPARSLLPLDKYFTPYLKSKPFTTMITSRGCPYRCIYCSSSSFWGHNFRARSAENVVDEIEYLLDKYKIREIKFWDDMITYDQKRIEKICEKICERGLEFDWTCITRVDAISESLLHSMEKAGCYRIGYGIESGSNDVLKGLKKGITTSQAKDAVKLTEKVGIKTLASFMLGNMGETPETIEKTIRFAKKLDPDYIRFTIATPYPGTEFYETLDRENKLLTAGWDRYVQVTYQEVFESDFPDGYLNKKIKDAYLGFYLRPKYLFKRFCSIRHFEDLTYTLRRALEYLEIGR